MDRSRQTRDRRSFRQTILEKERTEDHSDRRIQTDMDGRIVQEQLLPGWNIDLPRQYGIISSDQ